MGVDFASRDRGPAFVFFYPRIKLLSEHMATFVDRVRLCTPSAGSGGTEPVHPFTVKNLFPSADQMWRHGSRGGDIILLLMTNAMTLLDFPSPPHRRQEMVALAMAIIAMAVRR
jgi:hypothetical protein